MEEKFMRSRSFVYAALLMTVVAFAVGGAAGRIAWPQKASAADSGIIETVEPETMVVVDAAGNGRMFITLNEDNTPSISFHDAKGTALEVLSLSTLGEPIFTLNNNKGELRMAIGVTEEGGPAILLKDKSGKGGFNAPN